MLVKKNISQKISLNLIGFRKFRFVITFSKKKTKFQQNGNMAKIPRKKTDFIPTQAWTLPTLPSG